MLKFIGICIILWCLFHWWIIPLVSSVKTKAENASLKRELARMEEQMKRYR